jgi:hypothetical protein
MSYCRFENTFEDLEDCYDALINEGGIEGLEEESSEYEKPYIKRLIELCKDISEEFG